MPKQKLINFGFLIVFFNFGLFTLNHQVWAQSPTPIDLYSIGKRTYKGQPKLRIAYPEEKSTIFGHQVTIKTIINNLILVNPEQVKKNKKGQGHLHIWLDEEPSPDTPIEYSKVYDYSFPDVSAGKHTLTVEVVNNDHSSFDPPVKQTVTFTTLAKPTSTSPILLSPTASIFNTTSQPSLLKASLYVAALIMVIIGVSLWHYR